MRDHTIVCGFGTKGRHAVAVMQARGVPQERIVVVEQGDELVQDASRAGFVVVHGDAARAEVLERAGVAEAHGVVVAVDRDDTAVLITLTARELNAGATIVAAVREDQNRHLLEQSGASSVIESSSAAGRLLGFATHSPRLVDVLEDLLSVGQGLDIVEREVPSELDGRPLAEMAPHEPVVGVVRDDELLRFDDERARTLRAGDRVVCLASASGAAA